MESSRKCNIDICEIDVHRASYAKHLRIKNTQKMKNKMK